MTKYEFELLERGGGAGKGVRVKGRKAGGVKAAGRAKRATKKAAKKAAGKARGMGRLAARRR